MKKGTILSIDHKYAYVFTSDCRMVKLLWQPDMAVGKEINMETTLAKTKPAVHKRRLRFTLAAACLVLLITAGLIISQGLSADPAYAVLSIDVNPSLELSLNKQLAVISCQAMNDDAAQLLKGRNLTGLAWQDAIARWTEMLRQSNQVSVQTMLISAVMPENADLLRTQLLNLDGSGNPGALAGVQVRVIYSNDQSVLTEADRNHLSIGRQMLLNQARVQNENWDETSIADAPLGDLIQKLLRDRDQNQTRLTERTTQPIGNQPGESASSGNAETNRETSRQTAGNAHGAESQQADRETSRQTSCESNMTASCESNQSQQTSQIRKAGN
ncbi:MAG: anti-sigma factor domain-containing protein [Clostridiaceae bacterium]|nr:anti-sigma factor domain-containing protein [Clostridiaceae bacterium]